MKFIHYKKDGLAALGAMDGSKLYGGGAGLALSTLVAAGTRELEAAYKNLLSGEELDPATIAFLPPFPEPEKIICVGLNYKDHAAESGFQVPTYPALFGRVASSLVGHQSPIIMPKVSDQLDYEGELVAIIGKAGRNIAPERALDHVAGYSIFNDGSIRDYQFKTAQWMIGKNFDETGAFGPSFVTADELPLGAKGLRLATRLNGKVLQEASTEDLVFDVATLVSLLSDAMTLRPGDVIVTGTPSGVGAARNPKIFMKPGDVCEVEIDRIGLLSNAIALQS